MVSAKVVSAFGSWQDCAVVIYGAILRPLNSASTALIEVTVTA